jgi:hypothetical protein
MPWLVLGIAVFIGLVLIGRGLFGLDPKRAIKFLLLVFVVALMIGGIVLLARGGVSLAYIAGGLLLPLFLRWRAVRQFLTNLRGPSPGQNTGVETRFLRMSLDHDSGILDGLVLDGQFRGRRLSELVPDQLKELLSECRVEDEQSATVLEAYLDRTYSGSWRSGDEAPGNGESANQQQGRSSPWSANTMSRDEAYEILGLRAGASADDIKSAHQKLMMKIHPDHGGSNYLASKINQAKELLLGE